MNIPRDNCRAAGWRSRGSNNSILFRLQVLPIQGSVCQQLLPPVLPGQFGSLHDLSATFYAPSLRSWKPGIASGSMPIPSDLGLNGRVNRFDGKACWRFGVTVPIFDPHSTPRWPMCPLQPSGGRRRRSPTRIWGRLSNSWLSTARCSTRRGPAPLVSYQSKNEKIGGLRRSIGHGKGNSGGSARCVLQPGSNVGMARHRIQLEIGKWGAYTSYTHRHSG